MFGRRRLACSFCGKSASEVSKLVAGPKVHICDTCVATASRMMIEAGGKNPSEVPQSPNVWRRIMEWIVHRATVKHNQRITVSAV